MPLKLPAPHFVLHDFLPAGQHQALLAWTLAQESRFTPAGIAGQTVDNSTRRMLTAIYYFYRDPKLFTGGDLRLYDLRAKPSSNSSPDAFVTIAPEQNTLLVFPSELGHEVMPVIQRTGNFADFRFVVNCWLHRAS